MGKNWAISIGINKYEFLQPLKYANRDAQLMQEFLVKEAGFEQVLFFSDDSPHYTGKSTRPYFVNLKRVLRTMFEKPLMADGDNFWFFFSGHGMPHNGLDYLMACDSDPGDVEHTAISINYVTERLRRCGAENVVLILDACRGGQGSKSGEGIGNQSAEVARQKGVITFFSCSPNELSYELDDLQQGAFTKAFLDGLGIQGQCATVERLNHYLSWRVPELIRLHKKSDTLRQTPYIIAEPVTKYHLILCPRYASLPDVATMKNDAFSAEIYQNFDLAEQLWIRVLAASSGDMDAIKALKRIAIAQHQRSSEDRAKTDKSPQPAPHNYTPIEADVPLKSERGVDYTNLRDLLAAKKWKEADQETARVMFKAAGREKQGYLSTESIEKFPCEDLRTIDQLWVKYSNGHFGFSVRKHIYQSLGGTSEYNVEVCERLGDRVGWRQKNEWLTYKDITFSEKAPEAHLPCLVHHFFIIESTRSSPPAGAWVGKWVVSLLSRRDF
ncbi:GUN4 domain-containing protein [Microcoleus sp. BROC3]|uniref:GUN4 domain-containing protein n=1 Tax=Microcoleus sp. BROC3 TaxID=3055323 RepID=UPI002FD43B23